MLESDGPGGAETMLMQLAEELRRRGHHVLCVGPDNGCGWLGGELRRRGFATDVFSLRKPIDRDCLRGMVDMLRRHAIEIVHSHEFTMAIYGAAATRRVGIPHVITMHGSEKVLARWQRRLALRLAFASSRAVVAVSRATHAHLVRTLRMTPSSVRTIPNGIAFTAGTRGTVRTEFGLSDGDVLVLAVGNLVPRKGHIHLLRALAVQDVRNWHVAIAGRGDEEQRLRAFAVEAGIADRVHLLGHRGDIPDLLAAADVYAMPSLWEGLPMALLEAMFAGKAIVASRASGIPEAIDEGKEGLLADPGDEVQLATTLGRLLGDANLRNRLGTAARARAERDFSAAVMTEAYERAYGIRT
ncbi:MAG: glycosyl transferase group 1 [Gemmatimonadetes bacterium]|nr:glycosyl transferase group 1 [Gemmatimonadota bacterium]